jgi:RNA polymerase sigma factor (sigma-70 family)
MLSFLLTLADESDRDRIEELYNKYHNNMLKYAIAKLSEIGSNDAQHDAEDAVQNAFIKIVKNISNIDFTRTENEIKCYVFSILVNQIHDITNRDDKTVELNENAISSTDFYTPDQYAIFQENYDNFVKAIEEMDEIYTSTMFMAVVKNLSIDEIAEQMGIAKKTVYTRLERCKKLLKKAMEGAREND